VASVFPQDHAPVYHIPTVKLNWKSTDEDYKLVIERADQIIDGRTDRKGIVHTVSYARTKRILQHSRHSRRFIWNEDSSSLGKSLELFRQSSDRILVTPSVEEGFDFAGSACEYQIVLKFPFPNETQRVIKERCAQIPGYRLHYAAQKIVQMRDALSAATMTEPKCLCSTMRLNNSAVPKVVPIFHRVSGSSRLTLCLKRRRRSIQQLSERNNVTTMPKVSSAPEDAYKFKGSFEEGWGVITGACAIVYQFPPQKEASEGRQAGHQDPPGLFAQLTIQRYSDGEGNKAAAAEEEVLLSIASADKMDGQLNAVHPGKYEDGNPESDATDMGGSLGATGDTLFALADGYQINDNVKWMRFCASLVEKGFKPAILKRTTFPTW